MAKITNSAREDFNDKVKPYKDEIDKILAKEKNILSTMDRDSDNAAYKVHWNFVWKFFNK